MTNATTGIPRFPLSTSETANHIFEIMKSDSTQVGELLRGHLGLDCVNDGEVLALVKLMNTFIYVSETGSERFFINEEKGLEISFFQLIEFHYLKEKFPDADLSYLFKSKTYSFYHISYEAIHDFFETLLNYGVCFTVKKIELVTIDTTVRAALPLYESPRVLRRLQPLRRWSYEQIKSFFPRSTRTRCSHVARPPWRISVHMGGH